jgi:hypothetical protein
MYRANPSAGHDFRAYSCVLSNSVPELGGAAGKTATIYYRSEGGSAWGPVSIATNTQIARLQVNTDCTLIGTPVILPGVLVGVQGYNCPTSGYVRSTDAFGPENNLVKDQTDLGVSDVEPKMFGFPSFPISTVFPAASNATRQALLNALNPTATFGFGQTFGVIVNSSGAGLPGAGVTTPVAAPFAAFSSTSGTQPRLSQGVIAGIFNGTYLNWDQVPTVTGATVTATPLTIRVCRGAPGSGAQAAANQFFLGVPQCGLTLGAFRVDTAADSDLTATTVNTDTDGVIEMGNSGDVATCVATLAGSIGILVGNQAPAGTNFVSITGMDFPNRNAAAVAEYKFWYELAFTLHPALGAGDVMDLANGIIALSQPATTAPNVASVVALANNFNDPYSQGPFTAVQPPISYFTRLGNSCKALTPV